jgi:hypothetical protein
MTRRIRVPARWLLLAIACGVLAGCRVEPLSRAGGEPAGPSRSAEPSSKTATSRPRASESREAPGWREGSRAHDRRDLRLDEQRGGHTLARHVGRTDDELRDRLRGERISAASTYHDLETAEQVVAETLRRSADRVSDWTSRAGGRPNLALRYRGDPDRPIGRSILRGRRDVVPCSDAVVVLRWDTAARDYFVLTSYPEARDDRRRR